MMTKSLKICLFILYFLVFFCLITSAKEEGRTLHSMFSSLFSDSPVEETEEIIPESTSFVSQASPDRGPQAAHTNFPKLPNFQSHRPQRPTLQNQPQRHPPQYSMRPGLNRPPPNFPSHRRPMRHQRIQGFRPGPHMESRHPQQFFEPPRHPLPSKFLPKEFPLVKRECIGVNGSEIGECVDAYSCGESGGKPVGLCESPGSVCCSFTSFCGYISNAERIYLSNPEYPKPSSRADSCQFQLDPLDDVCQVRIDFLDFHLKAPDSRGVCSDDNAFHIESNDPMAFIPVKKLCGTLSEDKWDPLAEDIPHIYVHFGSEETPVHSAPVNPPKRLKFPGKSPNLLSLKFNVKNHLSSWNIRVSQISCDGGARLQAPLGCARYYTGENGTISSLNYLDGSYPANLDVTSCIRNEKEACGIKYNVNPKKDVFSIGARKTNGKLAFGMECSGDYLSFSGQKAAFCGAVGPSETKTFAFKQNKGPLSLHFHSDEINVPKKDVGFNLNYEFMYHCKDDELFSYHGHGI